MPRKAKKIGGGFAFNACSLCEHITVTMGQQDFGGIRYCRDCLPATLAWVQVTEEARDNLIAMFERFAREPAVIAQAAIIAAMSPEDRAAHEKKISVAEASYRLMQQNVREARGW